MGWVQSLDGELKICRAMRCSPKNKFKIIFKKSFSQADRAHSTIPVLNCTLGCVPSVALTLSVLTTSK